MMQDQLDPRTASCCISNPIAQAGWEFRHLDVNSNRWPMIPRIVCVCVTAALGLAIADTAAAQASRFEVLGGYQIRV